LGLKYNPKNESSDAIEKKVITYVTLHYLTVHKWLVDVDDTWHAANYYQVGFKGATYGHNILGLSEEVEELKPFGRHHNKHHKKHHNHLNALLRELRHLAKKYHI